jgi:hypothetical protein
MPTETRSIPACWEHWTLLSADLRSSLVQNYGRGLLTQYAESLLEAVRLWRQAGAWRHTRINTTAPVAKGSALNARLDRKVIQFAARRRTFPVPTPRRSGLAFASDRPISKAR